ncbi:MAG: carbon-nitrogen hydrolase family protein [Alphaproteobacteria bacterium]|nr:carbon-nitrogen hydrolase family protein [Alphaproteobacteria bacterium]
MRTFSIAGLQLDVGKGDNVARICAEIRAAKKRLPWVDMIVVGELSAYGPATTNAEPRDGRAESEFRSVAREMNVWLIPGSLFERSGDVIYNTTPVIAPDGSIVTRYRKMYPFYPYEEGVTPGDAFGVFDVPGVGRFGLSICYDIWFPEITRTLAFQGVEVVINPSLTNTIDREVELSIVRANAAMNQCYVFNVNCAGDLGFGRSIVCGPGGEVMYQAGTSREIFALELDLDLAARVRERGWHGLGQVLKSFRDNKIQFPPYAEGARSETFEALGPLEKLGAEQRGEQSASGTPQLRVAKT